MTGPLNMKNKIAFLAVAAAGLSAAIWSGSCGMAPTPFPVVGPPLTGNDPPSLTFLEPAADLTRGQGDPLLIRWTDSDRDDNAIIAFSLVSTVNNTRVLLVAGLEENDTTGPDSVTVNSQLVPVGTFNLLGTIDDNVNPPVDVFATTTAGGSTLRRIEVRIVGEGEGQQTQPPTIAVTQPQFNQSVSQDDVLTVAVQPSQLFPNAAVPFDPDSDVTLFVVLDFDQNPNNDDPASPEPGEVILLAQRTITAGSFEPAVFNIPIDLNQVPPRDGGEPYFIRVSADDGTNPRVHQYAVGTISVVRLAAGLIDLYDIGRTESGARFYGFSPVANVGSTISTVGDFDADGVEDFVIVAQKGNARNNGPVGEAYLIYGQQEIGADGLPTGGPGIRFGGSIGVNSVSESVSGTVFEAPPVRDNLILASDPRTDGITDASFIPDISGDGRPELLFGLRHVHGAFDGMDYDPGDDSVTGADTLAIEIVVRQGRVTVQEGTGDPDVTSQSYNGVEETTIRDGSPNTSFGTETSMSWVNAGAGERAWTLIKFRNLLEELPAEDTLETIDPSSIDASLEIRVFNTGVNGQVHQVLTDFNEQTTYADFAVAGGDPQEGVDYSDDDIGQANGGNAETVNIDVSDLIRQLIDGELGGFGNEVRFIIVPGTDTPENDTSVRTSEFNIEPDRPTLRINYDRLSIGEGRDCYPDNLVNNRADADNDDRTDTQFTAGGMVIMVSSENRDNQPRLAPPPARLESTAIAFELVGQEPGHTLDRTGFEVTGNIRVRADDYDELNRISGARFMAGPFDFEDSRTLNQPPRDEWFGDAVAPIGDLNNDGQPELIISAPRAELHLDELFSSYGFQGTHWQSTTFDGSIAVIPGFAYQSEFWTESGSFSDGNNTVSAIDGQHNTPFGRCTAPSAPRHLFTPVDIFQVYAEDITDMLGQASSAGDFNQDGLDDILCGAFLNDRGNLDDTGAVYILYGRTILGDFDLKNADDPVLRAPMLRVRGITTGDQIGWRQTTGLDVNGDRLDDVFIGAPTTDFGGIERNTCAGDFNGNGTIDSTDLSLTSFNSCETNFGEEVFSNDSCKVFDYDNDSDIDDADRCVFCCLAGCQVAQTCTFGLNRNDCCAGMVDNGFVGIIFGGVFTDGDRDITQIGMADLRGTRIYGAAAGHRAGLDVSSAGDFNQDGFGDLMIAVPGETRLDSARRERLGVVYLIFGGTHLENTEWNLSQVGSTELPGIIFFSPYVSGRPNEAAPTTVALIGDVNNDGFDDVAIGSPKADFIDLSFPQGPDAPGGDAAVGRRRNAGDAYVIYGNNFGSNRGEP